MTRPLRLSAVVNPFTARVVDMQGGLVIVRLVTTDGTPITLHLTDDDATVLSQDLVRELAEVKSERLPGDSPLLPCGCGAATVFEESDEWGHPSPCKLRGVAS